MIRMLTNLKFWLLTTVLCWLVLLTTLVSEMPAM